MCIHLPTQPGDPDTLDRNLMMNAFTMFTKRNRSGGEFLLIDAANAHTLLDIAETTPDAIEAHRLTQLARETLETINRYLGALEMDASLRAVLERSRDKLELRLAALERQYPVAAACL